MGIGNSELQGERSRAPRSRALRQGPLGPWTHSGEPASAVKQTISASLAYGAKRVPGQRKPGSQPKNECIHFSVCLPGFRGVSRRPTGKAGRPGTVAGVIQSTRGSYSDRRHKQHRGLLLCSFLLRRKRGFPACFAEIDALILNHPSHHGS